MLLDNRGDLLKARSNHWFFTYIPTPNTMISVHPQDDDAAVPSAASAPTTGTCASWGSCGYYLTFVIFSILALYTQIAVVHPTNVAWRKVTLEAFGFQHAIFGARHERLARKFHLKAQSDTVDGFRARIKAAEGERKRQEDARNATKMLQLAETNKLEAMSESQEAEGLRSKASREHELFLEYLRNASLHEQSAEQLKEEAARLANQSEHYHKIFEKYSSLAQANEELREAYLQNATYEGEVEQNITEAERNKEDHLWICRWGWSRQYVCGVFGGFTALGEAKKWHQKEAEDIQHAMDLQQEILAQQAKAMIAKTQAARTKEEARLAHLKAEEMRNATILDGIRAYEERAKELEDLQQELEDLTLAEEHLHKLEYYQALEVQLDEESRKEEEYSRGEWKLGSDLLNKAEKEQEESDQHSFLARDEQEKQRELVERANKLGRRLRLFSTVAAACALISLAFFMMALVTTNTVSLGYQVKMMAVAFSVTLSRQWEGRNTNWEGRSILGDHQDRNCLRQLSCWFHHCLCFVVIACIQGEDLSSIYTHDSWGMRGEILLNFAISGGCLEAILLQAVPQAIFLSPATTEYFRNVAIRFGASTSQFAIQMLLLLILCGQDSMWLFNWIMSLHRWQVYWIFALTITWLAHVCFIEHPYASSLDRNGGAMSDMTFSTYTTFGETNSCISRKASLLQSGMGDVDEEVQLTKQPTIAHLPPRHVNNNNNNNETESLLTVTHAEAPAFASEGSLPYSSISLQSAPTTQSTLNRISAPSPALQRLYEVSIQNEFFVIVSYIELLLLTGVLLVLSASLPHIAHR